MWACDCCKYEVNQPHQGRLFLGTSLQLAAGSGSPAAAERAKAAQHSRQPDHLLPALGTARVSFALFHPQRLGAPATGTRGHFAASSGLPVPRGGPPAILVKEPIQVNSDSIFPPLLDKQNREMPLTRKPSSNHLVFASHSLPVTVETTPLPPTCCQCLD